MYKNAPYIEIDSEHNHCLSGWTAITKELKSAIAKIDKKKVVIVVECHHGTFEEVNFNALKKGLKPNACCKSSHIFKEKDHIQQMVEARLGQGHYTGLSIEDYFDPQKKEALQSNIDFIDEGVILIFGIGASLIWEADLLLYADMSQWEIQQRFKRHDVDNIGLRPSHHPFDYQYLWAFFNDWPLCHQIRKTVLPTCDYYLETNNWAKPKLVSSPFLRSGLQKATQQPFRLAPFFDPLLWDKPENVPAEENNFDWCFNCMPDEDNLLFKTGDILFEVPLLSLIACYPNRFLGDSVVQLFGDHFPIYLDFIDTQETGKTNYRLLPPNARAQCPYEQLYYFLEAGEKSKIRIGHFESKLNGNSKDNALKFSSQNLRVSQHDFIFIPGDTPIQVGEQVIALFISNISNRLLLDIKPKQYLKSNGQDMPKIASAGVKAAPPMVHHLYEGPTQQSKQEPLLTDQLQQLRVTRIWFDRRLEQEHQPQIQILNLIQGDNVSIYSIKEQFPPQLIKHGETIIIPADAGAYGLEPNSPADEPFAILKVEVLTDA